MLSGFFFKLFPVIRPLARMYVSFQVIVEVFVRVEFRRILRQKEHFNFALISLQPCPYNRAVMNFKIIQKKKHFALDIVGQPAHEFNQSLAVHVLSVKHESDLTLICYRRDHVDSFPFGRLPKIRRFPLGRVSFFDICASLQAGLIAPMNFCILQFCPGGYHRILFHTPLDHGRSTLFFRPFGGLLRGKSPAFKVLADRPDGHFILKPLLDHKLDRIPSPERKSKFELVGSFVDQKLFDLSLLLMRKVSLCSIPSTACLFANRFKAFFLEALPYLARVRHADSDNLRGFVVGSALFTKPNNLAPKRLLDLLTQSSGVYFFHAKTVS